MISSGALPNVALSRPPTASPVRVGELLGREHDQPGDRHDGQRRREEQHRRRHVRELQRERDRDEREQPVERGFEGECHQFIASARVVRRTCG